MSPSTPAGSADRLDVSLLAGLLVGSLAAGHVPVHAEGWQLDRSLRLGLESKDNPGLAASTGSSGSSSSSAVLTGNLAASRSSESSDGRLALSLADTRPFGSLPAQLEGSLALDQSWRDGLDGLRFGVSWQRRSTLDSALQGLKLGSGPDPSSTKTSGSSSSDLLVGQGDQIGRLLSAGWTRPIDEAWSGSLQGSQSDSHFATAQPGAVAFRNRSLSLGLTRRVDETTTAGTSFSHSTFSPQGGAGSAGSGGGSVTDTLGVNLSQSLSSTGSGSLSLGRYRTRSPASEVVLVCPGPLALCLSGRLPLQRVLRTQDTRRWGLQMGASWTERLDERSNATFGASRQLSPSGIGALVHNQSLTLQLDRAWSERLRGGLNLDLSRTRYVGLPGAPEPRLRTLGLDVTREVDADTSLQLALQHSLASGDRFGGTARSSRLALTLQHDWPRLSGSSR